MALKVNIGEAKTRLSELISKVEAGEEVVIARNNAPIAKLSRIRPANDVDAVIEEIMAARAGLKPTSVEEILAWRDEGRKF